MAHVKPDMIAAGNIGGIGEPDDRARGRAFRLSERRPEAHRDRMMSWHDDDFLIASPEYCLNAGLPAFLQESDGCAGAV
jgi:hypothetical protein